MRRWKFETLDGTESYTFSMNPNQQESPLPSRRVTWTPTYYGFTGVREGRRPLPWSFGGVLRDQEMYDALTQWAMRPERIKLTDDRGTSWEVRLLGFTPSQEAASRLRHVPWRHTYTMRVLIYRELP